MSSSPRRAQTPLPTEKTRTGPLPEVSPFSYYEVGIPGSYEIGISGGGQDSSPARRENLAADPAPFAAQAKELGRQQGEIEARTKFEERVAQERSAVARALADFSRERAAYYQKIEAEAVQLALSIARKVLHREAQVDPVLLMGIARVAMEKLEGATGVVLAVHPTKTEGWRSYFTAAPGDQKEIPQIVEDPAMALEQCELRTSMGRATLGLEVQLKEIEQGLMDLLAARPQEKEEKEKEK
jgi:flagellar biosynthesis/type III secretory pathway protein FliH